MGKRFTETEKWRDPWFRKLSAGAKLAFLYILDNCDGAGVWSADKELADFSIGMTVKWDKVREDFGDRLTVLDDGKWLLNRFIEFQYGELSPDCKPHLAVLRLIEKHGLQRVLKGYQKGIKPLEDTDKEKEKVRIVSEHYPTLEQAKSAGPQAGVTPEEAELWWVTRDGNEWKTGGQNSRAVGRNWQSDMKSFTLFNRQRQHEHGRNGNGTQSARPGAPARAMTAFEIKDRLAAIDEEMGKIKRRAKTKREGFEDVPDYTPEEQARRDELSKNRATLKKRLTEIPQ